MLINQLFESTYSQYDKPTYLRNNPKEPTKKSSWTGVDMEIPAYKRKEQAELEKKRLNKEDVEQIDELSKGTLASYANKAVGDVSKDRSKNIKLADKKLYGNPNLNYKNEGTAYKATNPHPASRDPIVATVVKQMRPGLTGLEMGNEAFLYFAYELGKMRARDSWEDYLPAIRAEYEKGVNEDVNTDNKLAKLLTRFINQSEGADRAVALDAIEYIKKLGYIEQFATSLDYFGVDLDEGDSTVDAEKKQVIRALKNEWQFDRKRHGSLFDRGSADSYYSRSRDPHYGGVGGDSGNRVKVTDAESIAEYLAGFQDNEENGDRKDYS